ncbi:MAG: hypothetical protein QW038_02935 [Nanopusillaceae archaeon]
MIIFPYFTKKFRPNKPYVLYLFKHISIVSFGCIINLSLKRFIFLDKTSISSSTVGIIKSTFSFSDISFKSLIKLFSSFAGEII